MNERIDELIFQVGYTKLNYPDDPFLDGRYALTQEQLEKFADLLIESIVNDVKLWEKDSRNHISYMLRNKYAS